MKINKTQYITIILAFVSIVLLFWNFDYIHYLFKNGYYVESFDSNIALYKDTGSPTTTHTVDLPLTTKFSCKNFCAPATARCAITGEQCMADIDCRGCNPYGSKLYDKKDNSLIATNTNENETDSNVFKKQACESANRWRIISDDKAGTIILMSQNTGQIRKGKLGSDGNSLNGYYNDTLPNDNGIPGENDAGKLTWGVTPTYSTLTTDIGTKAKLFVSNKEKLDKPLEANFGVNTWISDFKNGQELFDERYQPAGLQFMPKYEKRYSVTGQFTDDGPLASNAYLK
jgi:hypothetical protein